MLHAIIVFSGRIKCTVVRRIKLGTWCKISNNLQIKKNVENILANEGGIEVCFYRFSSDKRKDKLYLILKVFRKTAFWYI